MAMYLEIERPKQPLSRIIESIIYYSGYTSSSRFELLLPDVTSQLVIALDEQPRFRLVDGRRREVRGAWLTGVQTRPLTYVGERNATTVSIRLSTSGFYSAFGIPLVEIKDQVVPARDILGPSIDSLRDRLIVAHDKRERVAAIAAYFLTRPKVDLRNKDIAAFVVGELQRGRLSMREIAEASGYSWKQMIHIFKLHMGVTPKQFQRLFRFNQLIALLYTEATDSEFARIHDSYFDQSHLIHEFRSFTDLTPRQYQSRKGTYRHVLDFDDLPVRG